MTKTQIFIEKEGCPMTFDQIETFLLIVQTNSISKAAEKL